MARIEQKEIKPDGTTDASLLPIRQRIESKLGGPMQCEFEVLKRWLQAPIEPGGVPDNNCDSRAKDLSTLLCAPTKEVHDLKMSLANPYGTKSIPEKWEVVDTNLSAGNIVLLKGIASEVGGIESVFKNSFHVILLLLTGMDRVKKKPWYIGFDPDCTATPATRALWDKLLLESDVDYSGVKNLPVAAIHKIIRTMILGENTTGVGPLIRKYIPTKTELLSMNSNKNRFANLTQ